MKKQLAEERFDIKDGKWQVSVQQAVQYTIVERDGFFMEANYEEAIFGPKAVNEITRRLVVIDDKVLKHFGESIQDYFTRNNVLVDMLVLSVSEEAKVLRTVFVIMDKMTDIKLQRRSEPVIVIGGGVLLDIVGLAASLYHRGIPYVRVPTTLIGMIDAGIGAKTAVNYNMRKNQIGTYYPPTAVLIDKTFLSKLDERHVRNGIGEILKMALIKDKTLFLLLEESSYAIITDKFQQNLSTKKIIHRSIQSMIEELEKNLWEINLERLVDFGHTFSPTLEMKAIPALLHGETVALDIAICVTLSYNRGLLTQKELKRIFSVYKALGLLIYHQFCEPKLLMEALEDSTIHRDGLQRMPLPKGIGEGVFVNDITYQEIENAVYILRKEVYE